MAKTGTVLQITLFSRYIIPLIFFSCCFVFLLLYIDPAVIYSSNGMNIHGFVAAAHAIDTSPRHTVTYADPWFRHLYILELTPEYFGKIFTVPGGLTNFAVTLCIYACRYPLAGAFTVTGLALFFYLIFTLYIQGTGTRRPLILNFVPAFFTLTVCTWYELGYCRFLLPIAGALGFAVVYQRRRPEAVLTRALFLSVLFWLAWYFTQWGCLLFLLFAVIHELFSKESRIVSVAITAVVNGVLLYVLDAGFIPLDMTIRWSDFMELSGLPFIVIGFFPLAAIILAVTDRLRRIPDDRVKMPGAIIRISLFVFGFITAAVWLYRDPVNRDTRTIARTVYHVMNEQWDAILREKTAALFADFPQNAGALQVFMIHATDHALCRTGQIGDRMFSFPQAMFSTSDPLLMLNSVLNSGIVNWVVVLDLAMDLGMVNTAEKIAGEIMEKMGPYPDIIYRRALIQIAKGNNDAAAVYLNKLAHMPFYIMKAKRLLDMLTNNRALCEPRIASMHANRDSVDYFLFNNVGNDSILNCLLQSNLHNKAAYDYLVTWYLLTGRLEQIVAIVQAAPVFGYTVLPRYWEEALCLYQSVNLMKTSSKLSFSGVRQETVNKFMEFTQAWLSMEQDPEAATKLAPAFGDSYFYFSIFRYSRGVHHE